MSAQESIGCIACPFCAKQWPKDCEQSVAVRNRGKCISCIALSGESICMDPYEFDTGNLIDGGMIVYKTASAGPTQFSLMMPSPLTGRPG